MTVATGRGPAAALPAGSSGGLVAADPTGTFVYADSGGNAFTFAAGAASFGTGSGSGACRIASYSRTSPLTTVTRSSVASSARAWVTTSGSLSTYAPRAWGTAFRALSCTLGDVGRPAPMSTN